MRIFTVHLALAVVFSAFIGGEHAFGDEKKVLGYIDQAEKSLEGKRASYTKAVKYYRMARKVLKVTDKTRHLELRIALGLARAHSGRRRTRDALRELSPHAQAFGPKLVPRHKGLRGDARKWQELLLASEAKVKAKKDLGTVVKDLSPVVVDAAGSRFYKSFGTAASFLIGRAFELMRKSKDAAEFYTPVVEAYLAKCKKDIEAAGKPEPGRGKAPEKIPPAADPPGKLEGKYKKAVDDALAWLKRHQSEEGKWSEDLMEGLCEEEAPCPPGWSKAYDNGFGQALAIQALVRSGIRQDHPDLGETLEKAVAYVLKTQAPSGLLARVQGSSTQEHALTSWALAELSLADPKQAERLKDPLARALKYIVAAQTPGQGWWHGIRAGCSSGLHTGMSLIALARLKAAGVNFDPKVFEDGMGWIEKLTDPGSGRTGFSTRGDTGMMPGSAFKAGFKKIFSPETSMALAARLLWSAEPAEDVVLRGFDLLWKNPPRWDSKKIFFQTWHYYSLAYGLKKGKDANFRLEKLADLLVENQEKEGCARGSWAPVGVFSSQGRIAATARAVLAILNAKGVALPQPVDPEELLKEKDGEDGQGSGE
jgi:hypothetical protein